MALSNSQYDFIMRSYQKQQLKDMHEQSERIREVYDRIPEIKELDDEISSSAIASARRLLDGDSTAGTGLKKTIEDLREQKAVLLKSAGYEADYMDMRYECPDCHDTGYTDGQKCHCFKREEMKLLYAQSNIEEIISRENFDTFSLDVYDNTKVEDAIGMTVADYMKDVEKRCRNFSKNFKHNKGSILFTGQTGVGKTFLTNCIAREVIDSFFSVIYLSATEMFDIFSKNRFDYNADEDMKDIYRYILECDLLIIDDLGTESTNSFTASQLFYCVNERILSGKGTIISTNLSLSGIRELYSDRVTSRIINSYDIIPLYGNDIRLASRF